MSEDPTPAPARDAEEKKKDASSTWSSSSSSSASSSRSHSPVSQPAGVSHLLETDALPEPPVQVRTVGVQRDDYLQGYLQFGPDDHLDSITEEDSDDVRSHSSASSHRAALNSAAARVAEQVAERLESVLLAQHFPNAVVQDEESPRVVELSTSSSPSTNEQSPSADEPREGQLLDASVDSSTRASLNSVIEVRAPPPAQIVITEHSDDTMSATDLDRDQTEVVVSNDDQFSSFLPVRESRLSNSSMSINLEESKDSVLDQSLDQPHDESAIVNAAAEAAAHAVAHSLQAPDASAEEGTTAANNNEDDDLPAPPKATPLLALHKSGAELEHSPAPQTVVPVTAAAETLTTTSTSAAPTTTTSTTAPTEPPKEKEARRAGVEHLANIVHGYGQDSPLLWKSSKVSDNKENLDYEPPRLTHSYVNTSYTSAFAPTSSYSSQYKRMDEPPHERPPPPPKSYADSFGYRTEDDLMSERNRSRATVREIPIQPIQRSLSAFGPSVGASSLSGMPSYLPYGQGGVTTAWSTTRHDPVTGQPQQEEYYRREVLTRTLVTRSTEALSAPPPLSRSSPVDLRPLPILPPPPPPVVVSSSTTRGPGGDEVTVEYRTKYLRNVEEEERRIRDDQDRRRLEEEERRRRVEEQRRRWEAQEAEHLERLRRDREQMEKQFEQEILVREAAERDRINRQRDGRLADEQRRREEWQRLEDERRRLEEADLEKRRRLELLEKERLERERLEAERLERERLERERQELERLENERLERERIERERLEIERLEIERIERIKREQKEKEEKERARQRAEQERLEQERLEAERLERERLELVRKERELQERLAREAAERDRERREDELREARRREEELHEKELVARLQREAADRERIRRLKEKEEADRLAELRRAQERLEYERIEAEKREQQRLEDERREKELLEAQRRAKERRDSDRLAEVERERKRQEEERREAERRLRERREADERERQRLLEEEAERQRLLPLQVSAQERARQRELEKRRLRERDEIERRTAELREQERREQEQREKERHEEERRLQELADAERRNAEKREQERREAAAREEQRCLEDRRSRDHLDEIHRERKKTEAWELERKRLLQEHELLERRRQELTSKETLEKLTRQPYYSRENLSVDPLSSSQPEVTTKVERQVIERVDRTLWTGEADATRYPNSLGTASYYQPGPGSVLDTHEDVFQPRERRYDPNNSSRDDDLRRTSSTRTSKYIIQKAKRDFFSGDGPAVSDPLSDRFQRPEETRGVEFRGPLLSKFNSGELRGRTDFSSVHPHHQQQPPAYPRVGPSPYDYEYRRLLEKTERQLANYRQRFGATHIGGGLLETDVDGIRHASTEDIHRSKSVLDHQRYSRRDVGEVDGEPSSHLRSKSADYLMDKKLREDTEPPENELQKTTDVLHRDTAARLPPVEYGEHEERFRKSMDKLISITPSWYQEHARAPPPLSQTTPTDLGYSSRPYSRNAFDPSPTNLYERQRHASGHQTRTSPPVGGISFPAGMFDRYKDEIEEMRRSRSSLHQVPLSRSTDSLGNAYSRQEFAKTNVRTIPVGGSLQPGYTVSTIPSSWNLYRPSESRVIEVADTFVGHEDSPNQARFNGRVTIEEVLDAIFQQSNPANIAPDPGYANTQVPPHNIDGPGIYTPNYELMDRVVREPQSAEVLLQNEPLVVRCTNCHKTRGLAEARSYYVSCKHCYTYYCSRGCRLNDWNRHKDRCSFARINTLCKEVIMKVRNDSETQFHMSKVARDGYRKEGRGSVNIRLVSAHSAQMYLKHGWRSLVATEEPDQLLFYFPIKALMDQRKEPSLIQLCRKYNPAEKFILSVSIIADIEQCPQTPPPAADSQKYGVIQKPIRNPALAQYDRHGALVPTDV